MSQLTFKSPKKKIDVMVVITVLRAIRPTSTVMLAISKLYCCWKKDQPVHIQELSVDEAPGFRMKYYTLREWYVYLRLWHVVTS